MPAHLLHLLHLLQVIQRLTRPRLLRRVFELHLRQTLIRRQLARHTGQVLPQHAGVSPRHELARPERGDDQIWRFGQAGNGVNIRGLKCYTHNPLSVGSGCETTQTTGLVNNHKFCMQTSMQPSTSKIKLNVENQAFVRSAVSADTGVFAIDGTTASFHS